VQTGFGAGLLAGVWCSSSGWGQHGPGLEGGDVESLNAVGGVPTRLFPDVDSYAHLQAVAA